MGGNVVPRRPDVAGVDTYTHPVRTPASIPNLAQCLESAPDRAALAGSGLQKDQALALVRRESPVQRLGDQPDAARRVCVGSRMDDQVRRADAVAPLQLVDEGGDRLLAQLARPASQVDQVG